MPSVVGLLEQRELGARRRVGELWEEADRIQAELAVAELEWQEWVVARRRVDTVLAPDGGGIADTEVAPDMWDVDVQSASRDAVKRSRRCRCGVRGCPGRCCRWTTSAFSRRSRTVPGSVKGR